MSWITFGNDDFITKSLLIENSVPFCEKEITTPFVGNYLFIPDTYLPGIQFPVAKYKQVETDMSGFLAMVEVETAVISPDASKGVPEVRDSEYVVSFYDSTSKSTIGEELKREFKEVLGEFTAIIGKNIKIGVPHKKLKDAPESEPNYFYIYLWSQITTNTLPLCSTPHTMWGIHVSCTDHSFCPSGKGIPIITDEDHCAAELVGNALYIHHDICHKSTEEEITLFARIVKEGFILYMMPAEELAEHKNKQIIADNSRKKEAFTTYMSTQIKNKVTDMYKNIKDNALRISDMQSDFIHLLRANKEHSDFLVSYEEKLAVMAKTAAEEYEKLLKIDKVTDISVHGGVLSIKTKPIYIDGEDLKGEKVIYFIGIFKIDIHLSGKFVFTNLSNEGKGPGYTLPIDFNANYDYNRHHPHIASAGNACLGNLSSVVAIYFASFQLSVLVTLLIKFLETVDTSDCAGRGIYWWPTVTEKT